MKEFTTAFEELAEEDDRAAQIAALVAKGKTQEEAEAEVPEAFIPFMVDGKELHAYPPTDGQLTFMLAALGRGQSNEARFASIINIMMESLRDEDKDYLESRLLTRNPKKRLPVTQVEAIFEYLVEQWFRAGLSGDGASVRPGVGEVE